MTCRWRQGGIHVGFYIDCTPAGTQAGGPLNLSLDHWGRSQSKIAELQTAGSRQPQCHQQVSPFSPAKNINNKENKSNNWPTTAYHNAMVFKLGGTPPWRAQCMSGGRLSSYVLQTALILPNSERILKHLGLQNLVLYVIQKSISLALFFPYVTPNLCIW